VYGRLDELGRATGAVALVTYDSMEAGRAREREDTSELYPTGWGHNQEVDIAMPDGTVYHGFLYNRSHLVAKSLGGDDALHNLICATRTQNVGANLDGWDGGMASVPAQS
jgi:DNA-entry nuclease